MRTSALPAVPAPRRLRRARRRRNSDRGYSPLRRRSAVACRHRRSPRHRRSRPLTPMSTCCDELSSSTWMSCSAGPDLALGARRARGRPDRWASRSSRTVVPRRRHWRRPPAWTGGVVYRGVAASGRASSLALGPAPPRPRREQPVEQAHRYSVLVAASSPPSARRPRRRSSPSAALLALGGLDRLAVLADELGLLLELGLGLLLDAGRAQRGDRDLLGRSSTMELGARGRQSRPRG